MLRWASFFVILASCFAVPAAFAQGATTSATATCNFDADKQLVLDYQKLQINLKKPLSAQIPFGKVWAPGGKPMTLFTNTPIEIHARILPVGAYTLFVIPGAKQWILIVSKSTDTSGAYDETQDLVRAPLGSGELPNPESELSVGLEHAAAGQCNIRIDLDKFGHFAPFLKH
jgi:Protein of unknown function (DUF2911)